MRRLTAVLVLALLASLSAIDGICCADGCTREQQTASTPHDPDAPDGICVLCAGGLASPMPEALSPGAPVVSAVARAPMRDPGDVPPDPPEHPPRS